MSRCPATPPPASAGSSPANVSDDLPEPDGPTTARNWLDFSFSTRRCTSPSRPKNHSLSASRNGNNPRYGHTSLVASHAGAPSIGKPCTARTNRSTPARSSAPVAQVDPRSHAQERIDRRSDRTDPAPPATTPETPGTRRHAAARSNATCTSGRCHAPMSPATQQHRARRRLTQTQPPARPANRPPAPTPHVQPRPQPPRPQLLRQPPHHRLVPLWCDRKTSNPPSAAAARPSSQGLCCSTVRDGPAAAKGDRSSGDPTRPPPASSDISRAPHLVHRQPPMDHRNPLQPGRYGTLVLSIGVFLVDFDAFGDHGVIRDRRRANFFTGSGAAPRRENGNR